MEVKQMSKKQTYEQYLQEVEARCQRNQLKLLQDEKKIFTEKVNNMTDAEFKHFRQVMYRTFNFIWTLEEMELKEVINLQNTPKEDNISMTSKELMETFKTRFGMDIE